MKPWDKQLDEKLQQALNRLEGDVTDAQWLRLSQKLDALDKAEQDDDEKIGAALNNMEGEVTNKQWIRLSERLDAIDHLNRRGKGAIWFTALLTCLLTTAVLAGWWYWKSSAGIGSEERRNSVSENVRKRAESEERDNRVGENTVKRAESEERDNRVDGNTGKGAESGERKNSMGENIRKSAESEERDNRVDENTVKGAESGERKNSMGENVRKSAESEERESNVNKGRNQSTKGIYSAITDNNNRQERKQHGQRAASRWSSANKNQEGPLAAGQSLQPGITPGSSFNPDPLPYNQARIYIHDLYIPGSLPAFVPYPAGVPVTFNSRLAEPRLSLPKLYLQFGVVSEYNMNKPKGQQRDSFSHMDARKLEQEQVNNGYTVGLKALAGYRLGTRLRFNIGLSLQQQVEQATVNYTYNRVPYKDINGKIIGYFTLSGQDAKTYNFTSSKTQLIAEIPVQVGTEIPLGRRMVLAPRIGIDTRMVLAASGKVYNVEKNQVENVNTQNLNRFNFGWNANLACYYRLNPRVWISAEPYYLQVAKPLAASGAVVQQTQSSIGLNLFLTYSLVK